MAFQSGFTLENHTIAALERHHNFKLDTNPAWDHKHKIDFIVYSIPGFRPKPLGVQITQKPAAHSKISEFLKAQKVTNALVERALYIEVSPSVPLDEGGVDLVALTLMQFQADRKLQAFKHLGVKIFDDMTYEFFDLEQSLKEYVDSNTSTTKTNESSSPPKVVTKPVLSTPEIVFNTDDLTRALLGDKTAGKMLRGVLTSYRPSQGFGSALAENGDQFFAHVYNIVDLDLKERLGKLSGQTPMNIEIPIMFVDGGRTKDSARHNEAKQITGLR